MQLQVGKIYNHSHHPIVDTRWKIIAQWNHNIFEGKAYCPIMKTVVGKSILFNASGMPIGAENTANYTPTSWSLIEPPYHEVILFYGDDSGANNWERIKSRHNVLGFGNTMYLVRADGDNSTLQLKTHDQMIAFMNENYPRS